MKARQQLAVVMDRRSLHKSRLESEALRRLESSTFLAASYDSHSPGLKPTRPLSAGNSRYLFQYPELRDVHVSASDVASFLT